MRIVDVEGFVSESVDIPPNVDLHEVNLQLFR